MKALVDDIHANGQKAQLWWSPMLAGTDSELVKNHPEMLLLNADGLERGCSLLESW